MRAFGNGAPRLEENENEATFATETPERSNTGVA